ncbi:MAG: exo-alpha-sialidase [Xanthobacteraceae bacterium]
MLPFDRAGASETTIAALSKETHFHGIAVDAADSSRIFLATHHGLYVVGTDGKAQLISEVRDYMGFTAHPTDAAILFASGHPAGGGNLGFIASKDGGRSWTKLSNGVGGPVDFHQMDVSKSDPRVIYGVYQSLQRSTDGGQTWQVVGPPPADIISLATSSVDANMLYAATQSGLQKSSDGGRSWNAESDRTTTMVHVTRDGTIYAYAIGMGLVRAAEKNLVWKVVGQGFAGDVLLHFAADPRDPQRLYAVTHNSRTRAQSVIASRDGGARWARLGAE